jgi:hypothetical protein
MDHLYSLAYTTSLDHDPGFYTSFVSELNTKQVASRAQSLYMYMYMYVRTFNLPLIITTFNFSCMGH